MSMYVLFLLARALIVSFAGAKVRRFFNSPNFLPSFFQVFLIIIFKLLIVSNKEMKDFWRILWKASRMGSKLVKQVGVLKPKKAAPFCRSSFYYLLFFCHYTTPWSSIACATFIKPAMLAPFT